jgi:hypothetical protein
MVSRRCRYRLVLAEGSSGKEPDFYVAIGGRGAHVEFTSLDFKSIAAVEIVLVDVGLC